MMLRKVFQAIAAIGLICLLAIGGCQLTHLQASKPESQWTQVEQTTPAIEQPKGAILAGSQFNRYFPTASGDYERVYTQEKQGFAEAKLKQNGQELAMLSVSDTIANPTAASKYQTSNRTIKGYPLLDIGSTSTGLLVADRIQVKVLSRDPNFTVNDREAWIQKFDLDGLASLVEQP
jgi:hypothetical protein